MDRRCDMRITKPTAAGNTTAAFGISWRKLTTGILVYGFGIYLCTTPLFIWNWLAIIGYFVLASILIGETPTMRSMFTNAYGVVFKKPIKMVVSDMATINTIGHGIKEIEYLPDHDIFAARLTTGHYALVYVVTSTINRWSTPDEYHEQAMKLKILFGTMDGTEGLSLVMKEDADTGMMQLKRYIQEREIEFGEDDDDLRRLSNQRQQLLHLAATSEEARSVQQYAILKVRPKNVNRVVNELHNTARLIRPAKNPLDVILATMGFEGGTILNEDDYSGKRKKRVRSTQRNKKRKPTKKQKGRRR